MKVGTPEQEAEHKRTQGECALYAMMDLKATLDPKFKPEEWGYKTVEEARAGMIRATWKTLDGNAARFLKSL